ncbi:MULTISPECIES: response regulator transcription factor [Microbacterium]|uniref:response regulator n=1 Tax=Microbacterium TaxID=33882 RepID=UPI0023DB95B3|nr:MULTISPECIES: response regulator transcription factor [Microbacterium]MDF2047417.1 response regulator transcription factor [Microbacterium sp. Kw_RZR3]MDQ1075386.1 DNA-binding NarL/FixJ family response regulator [Microbacterium sp. SORGH_AS_0969]MDQ1115616.1 DNA-binding NarL/FixJ family response regulator [Microbacterium testaceum]
MIRVVIVDDHSIVRAGLAGILETADDIVVVGVASDGVEAVAVVESERPDVVLMDMRMPRRDGDEATALLRESVPSARVIVLTTYESDDVIVRAIAAGAAGYLLKAAPEAELLAGVRAVAAGEVALAPSVARVLVARAGRPAEKPVLTAREVEVLGHVAQGLSNREIGRRLHLGEATVKTHLLKAFAKLDVADRTRAVTRAMELGIL